MRKTYRKNFITENGQKSKAMEVKWMTVKVLQYLRAELGMTFSPNPRMSLSGNTDSTELNHTSPNSSPWAGSSVQGTPSPLWELSSDSLPLLLAQRDGLGSCFFPEIQVNILLGPGVIDTTAQSVSLDRASTERSDNISELTALARMGTAFSVHRSPPFGDCWARVNNCFMHYSQLHT